MLSNVTHSHNREDRQMRDFTFTELDNLAGGTFTDDKGCTWAVHKKTGKCFKQKRMNKQGKKPWFETGETWTSFKVSQQSGEPACRWGMFHKSFKFHHNGNQTRRVR